MIGYLGRGHAVMVTLMGRQRQRSLKDDADSISMMLKRMRELLGDRAVKVSRGFIK